MALSFDTPLLTKMTPEGVASMNAGNLLSVRLRHLIVETLRVCDPPAFARYKALRGCKATATLATRKCALAFALSHVAKIAVDYYWRAE